MLVTNKNQQEMVGSCPIIDLNFICIRKNYVTLSLVL